MFRGLKKIWKITLRLVPDKVFLKIYFRFKMGYKLDLKSPKTLNEKIQCLKLYNRKTLYTKLADKYEVRKYIKENLGEEYLIPLIGVYDSFDKIKFDELPNQFVIKCNHDSASVIVCKDKKNFDYDAAKDKITRSLKSNYYYGWREWAYKDIKPRIIIEKYMEDKKNGELIDYKFYCSNGKCNYVMTCSNRMKDGTKFYYFDQEWNIQKKMSYDGMKLKENCPIKKPKNLKEMFETARKLSKKIPFVRIDLYNVDNKIFFGEYTFYPCGGFDLSRAPEAEEKINSEVGDIYEKIRICNKQ